MRTALLALLAIAGGLTTIVGGQGAPGTTLTDAQLFDDTVLQRLDLQINSRDWTSLRANYQLNTFYPATLSWRGEVVRNVAVRSRGSGTRSGQKPGLLVDFNRFVTGQHFLGLKAVVLDNQLQDPSAMREAVTMAVHAKLGLPAPREAPAEVYVNGDFFGVYTLVENIDSVSTKRLFAPVSPASLDRVMLVRPADPPERRARRVPTTVTPTPPPPPATPTPAPTPDVPTGYLFEYHWLAEFWETYPGPDLTLYPPMLEARTHETESISTLYSPIESLFREISQAPDRLFVERVGALIDLPLLMQQVAVQSFMADWDGVMGSFGLNNFYLYRAANESVHRVIPWDEDNTFRALDYAVDAFHDQHVLMRRAMQVPELRQVFFDTVQRVSELVATSESGEGPSWLEREIVRRRDLVAARMREDRVKPFSDEEFEAAVAYNLDFARGRADVVRQQLRQLQAKK